MRVYSKKLKNRFKDLISEIDNNDNLNKRQFAEEKVLPFLFDLFDEIVANDGLNKVGHGFIENAGVKMAIERTLSGNNFCIEKNNFFKMWNNGYPLYALEDNMRSVFHEARHLIQRELVMENDILKLSPYSIIYAKEEMISVVNYDFYIKNHDEFLMEIEANSKACTGSAEFISSAMPNSDYATQYADENDPESEFAYVTPISSYFKDSDYWVRNKSYLITDAFDNALKGMPEVSLLATFIGHPILKLAYHEDGTKKSLEEILSLRKDIIKANYKNLQKIIKVDDYKTTISCHINKIFAVIISTDKELSEDFENYLKQKEDEKASKTDDFTLKLEQKYKPKSPEFIKNQKNKNERTL